MNERLIQNYPVPEQYAILNFELEFAFEFQKTVLTQFYTQRLTLRAPVMQDTPGIFNYARDERASYFLPWEKHQSIADSIQFLTRAIERSKGDEPRYSWVISRKEDQKIIGMIGLRPKEFKAAVGYVLDPEEWNNGYMSEAFKGLISMAFAEKESLVRIEAYCDTENIGSYRVMEKAGLDREGILRNYYLAPKISERPRDMFVYSIVR